MSLYQDLDKEIYKSLEKIAYQKTKPFCYSCYQVVEGSHCKSCHSDDNMRLLEGVGIEYGIEWVIENLILENCTPIEDDYVEESLRSCYPETVKIGWIEVDTIRTIKELDPISYRITVDEYIDSLKIDGEVLTIGGDDFWKHHIEDFINENLEEVA